MNNVYQVIKPLLIPKDNLMTKSQLETYILSAIDCDSVDIITVGKGGFNLFIDGKFLLFAENLTELKQKFDIWAGY